MMYTGRDNGHTDTYMMPGTELNPRLPSPGFENFETITNDQSSGYIVDPSMYYPAATSYGYYCTGFESPGEWDEHNAAFGVDGSDVHYVVSLAQGAQTENVPYVYYAPNYGYGESPFNPYNPYIPGAMIGVDGSCVGTQQYYVSPYADPVSSAGYYPVMVQSGTNVPTSSTNTISDVGPSTTHRVNTLSSKRTHSSTPASSVGQSKATSQTSLLKGASQVSKPNSATTKRPLSSRANGSSGSASSHMSQSGSTPSSLQSAGTLRTELNQPKYSYPVGGSLLDYTSTGNGQTIMNDQWSKFYHRRTFNDTNGSVDPLSEQNRGPRSNKSKNQIVVKAYTTKAGNRNSEGNIVISADEYNKDDFPVDYANAKFFVIKSYSEDDVHKSIKYNVWSSTPNGNRKLNSAYEDAQKVAAGKPSGCPIFLFFSVNASGQFCGVAEMVGPVEFDKDMDFWQQDKWSGSFPVKWHIIKDVSNPTFRHIILENNEHKPVTNSRDTQEIMRKPGLEMLKVFKNYTSKTSLLDDFIYYENRQKIMYEERVSLHRRSNGHLHAHAFQQPMKLNYVNDRPPKDGPSSWVEKVEQPNNYKAADQTAGSASLKVHSSAGSVDNSGAASTKPSPSEVEPTDVASTLKIGSLSIHPKQPTELNSKPPPASSTVASSTPRTTTSTANVVTVGSMPVKVDGVVDKPRGMLTIGTIALDPKTLQNSKKGSFLKGGLQK
ncbi:hypothetical protein RND81_05G138800 [Saponaria officinalis]|uniref:YTH domain-containing family protein n=1 Tax=Saponaria officinalis TaxID=3572 RepID=A0AAW1KVJ7_SAPOF